MSEQPAPSANSEGVIQTLRIELAQGQSAVAGASAALRYLVSMPSTSLFDEEVLNRVRAMLADLAGKVLGDLVGPSSEGTAAYSHSHAEIDVLAQAFLTMPALLGHVHALALEWRATERLQARLGLDPVMAPAMLEWLRATDQATQCAAQAFVRAQARWCQAQRRMSLDMVDLPDRVHDDVLMAVRTLVSAEPTLADQASNLGADLRASRDPAEERLALALALAKQVQHDKAALLQVRHCGLAIFLTGLSLSANVSREAAAMLIQQEQAARLAVVLRSATLTPAVIEEQLLALHAGLSISRESLVLEPAEARALLADLGEIA